MCSLWTEDDSQLLGACGVDGSESAVLYVPVPSAVPMVNCRVDAPDVLDASKTDPESEAEEVVAVVAGAVVDD